MLTAKKVENKTDISGFVVERTAKCIKQAFQKELSAREMDVTADQWVILQTLDEQDGLSQIQLGEKTYKDAPTITRIIDLLCKKNLVERKANIDDRRRFDIFLTKEGKAKIKKVLPLVKGLRVEAYDGLSQKELNQLVKTLNKIYSNLKSIHHTS